ncbi:phosphocholine cytidylyltransferase family protein [Inquilinus sp. 2KB_12]|uniref:phosphocholine cytidylyltransferase family protein n=1 Tax=Inquilinus ginsengisoli TaxID=363840 RepID=UPI00286AF82F|nr:phosphocholine cytidylyltransferase family protein [Inquilinus ginsengisoli]
MSYSDGRSTAAIILAAGVGRRLGTAVDGPKILLQFGGRSLLERHIAALHANGVEDISITIGHEGDSIRHEIERLGLTSRIRFVENPRYREGSLVSLWAQRDLLSSGAPVVLMDGDVLYGAAMIGRLLAAAPENTLLVDREIEPGDEPVKICFRGDVIVDFRKKPEHAHDWHGESVGFFRFSPDMARALGERTDWYVGQGITTVEYEEAIRDLILAEPGRFGVADISDLPWTEIDFDVDVTRARQEILPQLER